jgi:hypothetical protein
MEWKYGNGTAFCGTEMEVDFFLQKQKRKQPFPMKQTRKRKLMWNFPFYGFFAWTI